MAIIITENGEVNYENEPNVNRELFPNLQGCCDSIQPEIDQLKENFVIRPTTEELKNIVGYTAKNLFDGIGTTSGKYVNKSNGKIQDLASYSVTDFFKVVAGATYKLPYHASGSQIAFYDINEEYVPSSGFVTTSDTFTVPNNNNIVFARWCADTANLASWALYIVPITDPHIKYIDQTEGILAGVIDAYSNGITDIIVKSGNYDIITEYKQKYGNTYFADYTSNYNGNINGKFDCGVWLDNVNIKFESGATVAANYDADADDANYPNPNVKEYFSAFAIGQNVTIDGLVLDASELRYGLHPDFHAKKTEKLTIKNCDLHHYKSSASHVNNNQAIGAGLGVYSIWDIENCIFRSDTSNPVLRIHNNASQNAMSKILIKDCYIVGHGYILLNSYSTSTKQTNALVTGCSWENPAVVGKETSASNDNITMYAWNNEVRT